MGDLIHCRQTFKFKSTVVIAASLHCYVPVQIVQNWQEADSLACNRLGTCPKGGHSASKHDTCCHSRLRRVHWLGRMPQILRGVEHTEGQSGEEVPG